MTTFPSTVMADDLSLEAQGVFFTGKACRKYPEELFDIVLGAMQVPNRFLRATQKHFEVLELF